MIVALRRLAIAVIVVIFVLIAAVFAYGNQEPIDLDIGIMRLENVSLTVTLAVTFAAGAVFGGLFSALAMLRHFRERRTLRRELRRTEAELENLRSLPLHDAD
jgi:uncharacterized membrane protein YciS (DUF1049 family)